MFLFFNVKIKEVNRFWLKRRIVFIFNERRYVSKGRHSYSLNSFFRLFFNLAIKEHNVNNISCLILMKILHLLDTDENKYDNYLKSSFFVDFTFIQVFIFK